MAAEVGSGLAVNSFALPSGDALTAFAGREEVERGWPEEGERTGYVRPFAQTSEMDLALILLHVYGRGGEGS